MKQFSILNLGLDSKFACAAIFALAFFTLTPNANAIQKCKDSEGKWHYGDTAEETCANSKVTTLTDRGFVKETLDAPKTEEERQIEADRERRLEEELAEQKKKQDERDRVLSIYEREEDIDRQRDNKLASVEGNIRVHVAYLKQMGAKIKRLEGKAATAPAYNKEKFEKEIAASKSRVVEFTEELERLKQQKVTIAEQFANEKELYREYKKG